MALALEVRRVDNKQDPDPAKEIVWLDVLTDCNLGDYMLCDSTYISIKPKTFSNLLRHGYWFLKQDVKAGDLVALHTGKGTKNSVPMNSPKPHTIHHIYWGLNKFVWNNTGDCALLFYIGKNWKDKAV